LMVTNQMDYVDDFVKAGASGFTFHVEVSKGWCCNQVAEGSY
jgi:ribulose-phosphate 3-epimerase